MLPGLPVPGLPATATPTSIAVSCKYEHEVAKFFETDLIIPEFESLDARGIKLGYFVFNLGQSRQINWLLWTAEDRM